MIPRLWVCTSHPWLQLLAAPLHPVTILGVMVAAWFAAEPHPFWQMIALRLRCLWQGLLLAGAGGFALIAIPGRVVAKLGADPNVIFVAARYIWVVLAWTAVALSIAWGTRAAAGREDASVAPGRFMGGAPGCLVLVAFVLLGARLFISDKQVPWSVPYMMGDFFFDAFTADLASDECLAFRTVDDGSAYSRYDPRGRAASALRRRGDAAIPGIVSY
jgi:hypothetical protein